MLLALSPWRALIGFADKDALIHFNEELNIPLSRGSLQSRQFQRNHLV